MTQMRPTLSIAAVSFVLLSAHAHSHEPGDEANARARESRFHVVEAEFEVRMHELELKILQRAVDEAKIESEKSQLHLKTAQEQGNAREIEFAKLQLKQSGIRVETHEMKAEMASLSLARAKARMEHLRSALTEMPENRARVQLEYVEDSDVIIVRGTKKSVDKIKALIENSGTER